MTVSSADLMMMRPEDQKFLKALPGNDRCCDCGRMKPDWASVNLAVFVCLECSGVHRSLGTHISFIRSVKMDSWTEAQIAAMKAGGNDKCKEFLASRGNIDMAILSTPIPQKYSSPAAELWRQVIKARTNGNEEPTELPEPVVKESPPPTTQTTKKKFARLGSKKNSKTTVVGQPVKVMEGFGSTPHPSELRGKKRGKKIMAVGAAAVGAIAAVGMKARSRKNGRKAKAVALTLSKGV